MFDKLKAAASAESIKLSEAFAKPGDSVTLGLDTVDTRQASTYNPNGPGQPMVDDAGEPIIQYVLTGTPLEKDEDGDWAPVGALSRLFVPVSESGRATRMEQALGNAMQASGSSTIAAGGVITITFRELGRAQGGMSAPKIYDAVYEPPEDEEIEDNGPWDGA